MNATIFGITACLIWSAAVIVTRWLAVDFGALRAATLEITIAGGTLLFINAARGDLRRMFSHSLACHLLCGIFWTLNLSCFWLAVGLSQSQGELLVVGLLNYLWPALTLLLAIPVLRQRATVWLLPGIILVVSGLVLGKLATQPAQTLAGLFSDVNPLAYSLAFFDALAWALYSNLSRKLSNQEGSSAVPLYMLSAGALFWIADKLLLVTRPPVLHSSSWLLLVGWSLVTGLAYLLWDIGMRRGNVIVISITSMFIPLISTILTAWLSGFGSSFMLLIAAALVVLGSALCKRGVVE